MSGPEGFEPVALPDDEFWRLAVGLSEPAGRVPTSGLVSNELQFQSVVPRLIEVAKPGRAYLGVGPEQNFTYISALQPAIAFIVDQRRDNFRLHLFHKVLFELADSRVAYLESLFSRRLPGDSRPEDNIGTLLDALETAQPCLDRVRTTSSRVEAQLCARHRFPLSHDDRQSLGAIAEQFARFGPGITWGSAGPDAGVGQPSFSDLMRARDRHGTQHAYLSSEERYARVRELHRRNRIVPVVGDFAGPMSLRAIGAHLRAIGTTVSAFYLSNVEYFLQEEGRLDAFRSNLGELPADDWSLFIRPTLADSGRQLPGLKAEIGAWGEDV